jgi:hypothetical protein
VVFGDSEVAHLMLGIKKPIPKAHLRIQPQQQSTQQPSTTKNAPNDDTGAAALASVLPQTPLPNQRNP